LDFVAAAALFKQAGARGCAAADFNLAVCHETGAGVAKDLDKAKALFRRALALGVCKAHVSLGYLAMHDGELSTAARHFERVANGRLVENGLTKADVADATFGLADVHERAADLGVARLQRALANGTPVDQNRLADLRSESFFFVTGDDENENESESYENDLCTAHDATDAAARRGATLRALELTSIEDDVRDAVTGDLLDKVGEARERCETLTRAAAEAGDGRASFRVGVRMWRTTHVLGPREETMAVREEAARWVLRGADVGCGRAYRWLGDVAVSGACRLDSKKDAKTARALYDLAQKFGDRFGAKRLAWLEEKTWCGAKKQGLLRVFPTAPPKAWRRVVPPEWLDEAIAGRSHS
jgi:TPR repeat protein